MLLNRKRLGRRARGNASRASEGPSHQLSGHGKGGGIGRWKGRLGMKHPPQLRGHLIHTLRGRGDRTARSQFTVQTRSALLRKVGGHEGQGITAPVRDAEHRGRFFRAQTSEGRCRNRGRSQHKPDERRNVQVHERNDEERTGLEVEDLMGTGRSKHKDAETAHLAHAAREDVMHEVTGRGHQRR